MSSQPVSDDWRVKGLRSFFLALGAGLAFESRLTRDVLWRAVWYYALRSFNCSVSTSFFFAMDSTLRSQGLQTLLDWTLVLSWSSRSLSIFEEVPRVVKHWTCIIRPLAKSRIANKWCLFIRHCLPSWPEFWEIEEYKVIPKKYSFATPYNFESRTSALKYRTTNMNIKRGNLRATKKWHKSEARPGDDNGYGLVTF